MAMLNWTNFIERRITWGNVATMFAVAVGWAIAVTIWYSQVSGHSADLDIHPPLEKRQIETDARIHLLTDSTLIETNRRLTAIEGATTENTKLLNQIIGRLEGGK